jgi:hypothetical protein
MPSTLAVDKIKTLSGVAIGWPPADGAANTILGTDGLGQLSFRADAAGEVSKGADIVSADPLVITTGANYFICTGTTGFNDMTVGANRHFYLEFSGILTMTHNAGVLDLPSGAAIVTAVGDVGEFYSTAANVVTCVNYTRADGTAVVATPGTVNVTNTAITTTDQSWTGSQRATLAAPTWSAPNLTFDLNAGQNFSYLTVAVATINFSNIPNGQSGYIIFENGGTHTISKAATTKTDANLLATISVTGKYILSYISDGTNVYLTNSALMV